MNDLVSHYCKDLSEFASRYTHPISQKSWTDPLVPIVLETAKHLFMGAEMQKAPDGSILIGLDRENLLALTCLSSRNIGAFATREGNTYFTAINYGLIRFLFNLSLSIWRDRRFIAYLQDDIRDLTVLGTDLIPLGFEEIFLDNTFEVSNQIRQTAFYKCFEQVISFFWLHEVGHIVLGHIDICQELRQSLGIIDEFLSIAEPDEDSESEVIHDIPYHAFEIQADRWALDRIFEQLHKQIMSDSAGKIELIYTTIACTLFPLSLHGYQTLQNKQDFANRHPPLWFRADDVLQAEDRAANKQWFSDRKGQKKFEMIRYQQKTLLDRGLVGLAHLHPIFGDWVSPVAELSRESEAQFVLTEAAELFKPWKNDLSHYCHSIRQSISGNNATEICD